MPDASESSLRRPSPNRAAKALAALIAISAAVRAIIIANFRVRASWDTDGYILAAQSIARLDFSNYDGKRTPIYPMLMLLGGMDWDVIRWMQALLGIAIASMMFGIAWHRTRNVTASFVVGLLCSLALSELAFEQVIYSETLCTFWIVLSVFTYQRICDFEFPRIFEVALLGLTAALAGMTRPMFLFLGPLYFILMIVGVRSAGIMRNSIVLAPTLVLALGWSMVNKHVVNYFGVTTTTGYNLSNHSGAFMELAPKRYSAIRDIYLRYRTWQIPRLGTHAMTIWYAEGEIRRATGLSYAELSKQLTRMSLEMFVEHPLLYLESVARAWGRCWGFGIHGLLGNYRDLVRPSVYLAMSALGWLQVVIDAMFLLIASSSIWRWLRGHMAFDFDLVVIAIVLMGSMAQAFMEYGENVRYLAPLVPLAIYATISIMWRWLLTRGTRRTRIRS